MITGIDVSSVQGVVQWHAVAAQGHRFAVVKGFEGNKALDPPCARNAASARSAGLVVGVYNFVYPLPENGTPNRSPEDQARLHFDATSGIASFLPGDLPVCVDAEWPAPVDFGKWDCTAAQIREWLLRYLETTEQLWGRAPIVYVYPDWAMHAALGLAADLARYPLWIADYSQRAQPVVPPPWKSWTLRQTTGGGGRLPNGAPVDTDVFSGDEAAWETLIGADLPSAA